MFNKKIIELAEKIIEGGGDAISYGDACDLAHLPEKESSLFQSAIEEKRSLLQKSIERIWKKDPVVGSECLKKNGIPSGKSMGYLLKEAEKIAIEKGLENPENVIEELKKTSLWPKS